jgi:hypothetical protein
VETFVVEIYVSRNADGEPQEMIRRVGEATLAATAAGEPVSYLQSIFVPDDESCLLVLEASSAEAVDRVIGNAGHTSLRIAPAWTGEGSTGRAAKRSEATGR